MTGMYGITAFSAVINPPQACILAVGAGIQRVLPPLPGADRPRVATTVTVQLSADRRVVDEATAAQFLQVRRHFSPLINQL
jgi:pyruvate dehydrogenase E2 component (dihydrolipoamide acetyltransferase)